MTVKTMVVELFNDMKVVRPIVENLNAQNLDARLRNLETTAAQLAAVAPATAEALKDALHNVEVLMADKIARESSIHTASWLGNLSNKAVIIILAVAALVVGIVGDLTNHIQFHP